MSVRERTAEGEVQGGGQPVAPVQALRRPKAIPNAVIERHGVSGSVLFPDDKKAVIRPESHAETLALLQYLLEKGILAELTSATEILVHDRGREATRYVRSASLPREVFEDVAALASENAARALTVLEILKGYERPALVKATLEDLKIANEILKSRIGLGLALKVSDPEISVRLGFDPPEDALLVSIDEDPDADIRIVSADEQPGESPDALDRMGDADIFVDASGAGEEFPGPSEGAKRGGGEPILFIPDWLRVALPDVLRILDVPQIGGVGMPPKGAPVSIPEIEEDILRILAEYEAKLLGFRVVKRGSADSAERRDDADQP